jgi:proteasome alpha subunit
VKQAVFGGGGQPKYDRALTVFSPEGRLYQVEYALEAVRRGTLAVAVKSKEDVVLAAQIKIPTKLMDPDSIDKIFQIDKHIGVAISGLHADSRQLVDYSRVQAQSYRLTYNQPVLLRMLCKEVADHKQMYTQYGGIRPYGCALFFIGIDDQGTQVYTTSPSGIYRSYKAYALGNGEATAREYIRNNYNPDSDFEEIVKLALNALKEAIDEEITPETVRLAYIKGKDKTFRRASKEEVGNYIDQLKTSPE